MTQALYSHADFERESGPEIDSGEPWRLPFSRDYGRVVHSASFRRLQGKTQVFPGHESDFFRNRLTHSLEVAQIAEGIAERLNYKCGELNHAPPEQKINARLCAVASLIHDLGHPPFGHNGERALDDAMRKNGGFEGNAQTLRIVSRLEKKVQSNDGQPLGLDLTYRTLASILKYDKKIPHSRRVTSKIVKGYYFTEEPLVRKIRKSVVGPNFPVSKQVKTIECAIMDMADDIAYSTFDLEDSLKAGFLSPSDILSTKDSMLDNVAKKVSEEIGYPVSKQDVLQIFTEIFASSEEQTAEDQYQLEAFVEQFKAYKYLGESGYLRTKLSSKLINNAINSVQLAYNKECPALSNVYLTKEIQKRVEVLKQYTFMVTIYSSRVKLPEYRGYEVVRGIFEALSSDRGHLLMPDDVRQQHEAAENDHDTQMRVVSDFVAGMTDRYAMEFFGRLHSDSAQSMFKPV